MKIQTTITGITHDDLVNLFSTATYGSDYLDIKSNKKRDYNGTELENEEDCREDIWAKILLAGKSVEVIDYYAEGVKYGNLPCVFDEEDNAHYTINLKDVKEGLEKALNGDGWERKCALHLIEEDGEFDLYEAEALLQMIAFSGQVIYG